MSDFLPLSFVVTVGSCGRVLRCPSLPAPHLFTTRDVNVRADSTEAAESWRRVGESLDLAPDALVRAHQVHGRDVFVVRAVGGRPPETTDADIVLSDDPAVAVTVRTADCAPILIADGRLGVVAAVHAGWRGTALGVAGWAVRAMRDQFGSRPQDVSAAIGPCIGPARYEVGEAILAAFEAEGHRAERLHRWFPRSDGAKPRLDLWTANTDQLLEAGVAPDRVWCARACTLTHPDWFFSHRGEGERTGRMVAAIRAGTQGSRLRAARYGQTRPPGARMR